MILIPKKVTKRRRETIIEPDLEGLDPNEFEIVMVTERGYYVVKKQKTR